LDLATDAEYVAKCQYVLINVQQCSLLHGYATGFHPDTIGVREIAGIRGEYAGGLGAVLSMYY